MKRIEASVKPFKLEGIKAALAEAGVSVLRVIQASEHSTARLHSEVFSGTEYPLDVSPVSVVTVVIEDERVDAIVALLQEAGQTEQAGAGWILISTVDQYLSIDSDPVA